MLRKIRICLALLFFIGITLLFLDFTGTAHAWLGWMARIQFLPAAIAANLAIVLALLILTFLFGRVYCSIICPLGVFQDIASRLSRYNKKRKYRFSHSPSVRWLRYCTLGLFITAIVAGIGSVTALLAPYSSYGRIAQNLLSPIWIWGNNVLAYFAERADSYAFYEYDVWMRSLPTFIIASVSAVAIFILAWRNGRTYCNTVCPVGTVLGAVSRFSIFAPVINKSKCNSCGLCSRSCKAACIDGKNHSIDYTRCVACFDCVNECRHEAISYTLRKSADRATKHTDSAIDNGRRTFVTAAGLALGTVALQAKGKTTDGGLATILDKKVPVRNTPIVPPGALSLRHLQRHCTGCQLCVAACPNGVLRPSTDLLSLMQPQSSYERGFCRPECTRCSEVCPAGAITKITNEEKSSIQIGHAVWIRKNCIPLTDGVECGNCARKCPAGAITMVASDPGDPQSVKIPVVNNERCIGCGACENLCPAQPFSAIYVEGHEAHRFI